MNSQSVAGLLGAIIASIVMVVAIAYGPIGQFGKPARPAGIQQPAPAVPAAPAPRGPVIREVPNWGWIALAKCSGVPIWDATATLTLQSSGAGTTMNSLA